MGHEAGTEMPRVGHVSIGQMRGRVTMCKHYGKIDGICAVYACSCNRVADCRRCEQAVCRMCGRPYREGREGYCRECYEDTGK